MIKAIYQSERGNGRARPRTDPARTRTMRLVKALTSEVARGLHLEQRRFLPRRRIEMLWGVSSWTADAALQFLIQAKVLKRAGRKRIVVGSRGIARARAVLEELPAQLGPLQRSELPAERDPGATGRDGSAPAPGADYLIYERLIKSLLLEIASGDYRVNRSFLARREIQLRWKVARSTVERAREELVARRILSATGGRIYRVRPRAVARACILLDQTPAPPLPPPSTLGARRNRLIHGEEQAAGYRLALVHIKTNLNAREVLRAARETPLEELNDKLYGRRDFASFVREAEMCACTTSFILDDGSPEAQRRILRRFVRTRYDGVAFFHPERSPNTRTLVAYLRSRGVPVLTAQEHLNETPDVSIECNETAAGYTAMKVLLEHGHRDILLISKEPKQELLVERRLEGVRACLRTSGVKGETRIRKVIASSTPNPGLLDGIFSDRTDWPTAILALDNHPFLAIENALYEAGVRIPRDLSLIVCGPRGFKPEHYGAPDVIDRDRTEVGALSARNLIRMIHGDPVPKTYQLENRYFPRGTVRKPRRLRT